MFGLKSALIPVVFKLLASLNIFPRIPWFIMSLAIGFMLWILLVFPSTAMLKLARGIGKSATFLASLFKVTLLSYSSWKVIFCANKLILNIDIKRINLILNPLNT